MIKFTYKQITRILDLIDAEIDRVEDKKSKMPINTVAVGMAMDGDSDNYYVDDKKKFDRELELLNKTRENFESLLDKLDFSFTVGEGKYEFKEHIN